MLLSNDGVLAMARIWPDLGSIATAAPILPRGRGCARTAAARLESSCCCSPRSIDSRRSAPGTGSCRSPSATGTPFGSTYRHCRPLIPRSTASYCCSSPARPTTSPGGRSGQRSTSWGVATPAKPSTGPSSGPVGYARRGSGTTNTPSIPAAVTASPVPRGTSATGSDSVVPAAAFSCACSSSRGRRVRSARRSTLPGRARSNAGTTRTRSTPLPTSAAFTASGRSCRSAIAPREAGSRTQRVIWSCPAAKSASPWVVCSRHP